MKNTMFNIAMAVMMLTATGTINAQDNVNIGKSNIRLQSDLMTPEALWAMGRNDNLRFLRQFFEFFHISHKNKKAK